MISGTEGHLAQGFACITRDEWELNQRIGRSRLEILSSSPPYESLIGILRKELNLVDMKRERAKGAPNFYRAIFVVEFKASTLDIFFNSATGYRAQYYQSAELGARANRFAIEILLPDILAMAKGVAKKGHDLRWFEQSLHDMDAKLWPHQGLWIRRARPVDRNLSVKRWVDAQNVSDEKRRKKAIWSMLTPKNETLLEVKGGFLSKDGQPFGGFKPDRSKIIHELGFT